MSHYINSFLIEPVVRQARRFSRTSHEDASPPPSDRQDASEDRVEEIQGDNTASIPALRGWHRLRLTLGRGDPNAAATQSPEPYAGPHGSGNSRPEEGSDMPRGMQPTADVLRQPDSFREDALAHTSRSDPHNSAHEVSNNPVYDIPESLRSTTSSLSSSVRMMVEAETFDVPDSARTTRQNSSGTTSNRHTQIGDGLLPADDGMGQIRKRIVAIQRTDSSSADKARLIHQLMTEQYTSSQSSLHAAQVPRTRSPASLVSHERPFTPASLRSFDKDLQCASPPTPLSSLAETDDPFNLGPEDLKPTYYQKPPAGQSTLGSESRSSDRLSDESEEDPKPLGCPHYRRNIKLQCSACDRWYTCRFCHDGAEDHSLNRRATKNMLCMLCGCAQPASEECAQCGECSARYYCSVCKLWDDDPAKSIYHCNDCGICRVGQGLGKDFYHCKVCCVCLSISIRETHTCIERSTDCDCPICGEYMFTSPQTVVFMKCGHSIHHSCYHEHMKRSYRCPICSRSMINMEMQFRHLERAIESQPMPPEFQDTKAWIYCNDCNSKSSVKYHWLGLKCGVCDSYNTAQMQMIRGPNRDTISRSASPTPPSPQSPQARGRAPEMETPSQRISNSAPPAAAYLAVHGSLRRNAYSQEPEALNHPRSDPTNNRPDSVDTDDEERHGEVSFWGLDLGSSRERGMVFPEEGLASDSDDEDGSPDESYDDDMGEIYEHSDEGEEDEDEEDDEEQMDIYGHR